MAASAAMAGQTALAPLAPLRLHWAPKAGQPPANPALLPARPAPRPNSALASAGPAAGVVSAVTELPASSRVDSKGDNTIGGARFPRALPLCLNQRSRDHSVTPNYGAMREKLQEMPVRQHFSLPTVLRTTQSGGSREGSVPTHTRQTRCGRGHFGNVPPASLMQVILAQ